MDKISSLRKVIVSMNVTFDGFMAGPGGALDWHFPHWNEEMSEYAYQQLSAMDTILLGRLTYQAMADYWPSFASNAMGTKKEMAFADMMNKYPKIVFSNTLSTVKWENARLVKENMGEEVLRLKQALGKGMILYGSGSIVQALMQLDLIDEYHLWIHPVVIGSGRPLFQLNSFWDQHKLNLRLFNTKTFSSGVVILFYEAKSTVGSASGFNSIAYFAADLKQNFTSVQGR